MTIDEIMAGESENTEFKVRRPEKSNKYMKSVVPLLMEPLEKLTGP